MPMTKKGQYGGSTGAVRGSRGPKKEKKRKRNQLAHRPGLASRPRPPGPSPLNSEHERVDRVPPREMF